MWDFLRKLFDTSDFPARWNCGNWTEGHGWLHIASDLSTWVAYTGIPIVLLVLVRKRKDLPFPRIFWLFCVFILACGTVHLVEAMMFWWPAYRVSGVIKLVTAVASMTTLIVMVPFARQALELPEGLVKMAMALEQEGEERRETERALRRSEERLQLATDAAGVGTWTWNLGTGAMWWDDTMLSLFGLQRDQFDDHFDSFATRILPADVDRVTAEIERCRTDPDHPLDVDFRIRHSDGTVRHLQARASVERDPRGVATDVTGVIIGRHTPEAERSADQGLRRGPRTPQHRARGVRARRLARPAGAAAQGVGVLRPAEAELRRQAR